jgi:hypothetical protein
MNNLSLLSPASTSASPSPLPSPSAAILADDEEDVTADQFLICQQLSQSVINS